MERWYIGRGFCYAHSVCVLGLGYLIHMYGENKTKLNYFKVGVLFLTTFVFDVILAYQIEEKIYNLNKTFDSPPFDLSIAFTKIQFWGLYLLVLLFISFGVGVRLYYERT